jgi:MFS family permease
MAMARLLRADAPVLAACVACPALIMGLTLAFPVWVLPWTASFGVARSSVMLTYALAGILTTGLMPFAGRLLVRVPAWRLIAIGGLMMGGGFLLLAVATAYWQVMVVYAVAAAGGGVLGGILPAQTLAVRKFPQHVGAIGGLMMIGIASVSASAPLLLTPLLAIAGWRTAVLASGAVILATVPLLAWTFLREGVGEAPDQTAAHPSAAAARPMSTRQILGQAIFWVILIGLLPMITFPTAVKANLIPFLADRGVGAHQASYLLSALSAGSAVGALSVGWLADRVDPRLVAGGMAAAMICALLALASGADFARAAAATTVMGLAAGGILPLMATFTFRAFGAGYAPVAGLMSFFMIPSVFGPAAVGWVRDLTGRYEPAFLLAIPVIVAGAIIVWRFKAHPHAPALAEPQPAGSTAA